MCLSLVQSIGVVILLLFVVGFKDGDTNYHITQCNIRSPSLTCDKYIDRSTPPIGTDSAASLTQ